MPSLNRGLFFLQIIAKYMNYWLLFNFAKYLKKRLLIKLIIWYDKNEKRKEGAVSLLQNKLEQRVRYFSLILFLSFLIKYNYLMLYIFQTPSIISLALRNIIFAYFYINFIEPLLVYKRSRQRLFILVIVFTTFFFSNYFYNRYFGNFLSVSDIMSAEGLGDFSLYEVLFRHIIRYRDVVFILDIIILGFLGFSYLPDFKFIKNPQRIFKKAALEQKFALVIVILLIGLPSYGINVGGLITATTVLSFLVIKYFNCNINIYNLLKMGGFF